MNHKIDELYERALRIVNSDRFSSFEELYSKNKFLTVHQRNLQIIPTEMYKILTGLSPDIMQDIFKTKSNYYNTRNRPRFSSRNIKTVRYELQTIYYMGSKIWNVVPKEIKQIITLNALKAIIKIWKLENCPCRICRTYLLSTDKVHCIMLFNMNNVVRLSVRGSLSGNIDTAEIWISIRLTLIFFFAYKYYYHHYYYCHYFILICQFRKK